MNEFVKSIRDCGKLHSHVGTRRIVIKDKEWIKKWNPEELHKTLEPLLEKYFIKTRFSYDFEREVVKLPQTTPYFAFDLNRGDCYEYVLRIRGESMRYTIAPFLVALKPNWNLEVTHVEFGNFGWNNPLFQIFKKKEWKTLWK